MDILSDKIVKTRKPHICSACSRRFEAGSKMRRQVNNGDELVTWYECETCIQLLTRHRKEFDDGYNVCWMNCVDDSLDRGQTPEDLLGALDESKLKARVLPISDVRLSFAELKDEILKYKAKSEYQQATIVILRNIFKAHEA